MILHSYDIPRWTALALVLAMAILCAIPAGNHGICIDAPVIDRMTYPLLHASIFHCAVNAWCLLGLVFLYDTPLWQLAVAYAIAITVPDCCLDTTPTVGFSGVCFALIGLVTFKVAKPIMFTAWILFYILLGFLIQGVNPWVHLFCYIAGVIVGLISTPLSWTI